MRNRPLHGVFWMVLTGLCFVGVAAVVKHLGGRVPAAQAAFLRYVLGLVFLIPMIKPMLDEGLDARGWKMFGLRGVVHSLGVTTWFFAMGILPVAEVTAMNYLAPVLVTIGAAIFLGEKLAARRIAAVVVAMVGVLVILRPGFREVGLAHLAMLFTATMFAAGYLIAKVMADRVSPTMVVGMLSITVTIGLAPMALAVWETPTMADLGWLFVVAALATAGHYTMTFAFREAPVTVTQPVTFLQLVWATLVGLLIFNEPLDGFVILGGGLILGAVVYIAWREAQRARAVTPPAPATKTP
ncbi:DMT family transporter [Shimia ponticola]|uniref:DMT family transporter n=1 Tax=Shimia ponticola TaxID=2582893 RepID=UPI0011BDF2EF|nr:DMT family transporter [Shimia ponticola]